MPFGDAQSLTAEETYALTAYLLYINDLVGDDFVLTRENFADQHLPNEGNFTEDPRPDTPTLADGVPCMKDCRGPVEISMRAAVLDVTPDQEGVVVSEDGSVATPAADAPDAEAQASGSSKADQNLDQQAAAAPSTEPVEAHPELVAAGGAVFRKCKACHQVGEGAKNRVGPELNGVIGRTAGSVDDFHYSDAMEKKGEAGLVWNAETLDAFLADPRSYVPGTKMTFAGLKSPEDRAAVATYLSQFD